MVIANQKPGDRAKYPANEIVDAGFLELVRFGIRQPGDPLIEDSLKVVDAVLKVDTPFGPCWQRYNHDGYGQRADGTSFKRWGVGHAWPLLIWSARPTNWPPAATSIVYLRAAEAFATGVGLFPEQIWDAPDIPEEHMFFGKATGAAIPLMWAHAEYVKMLRSVVDNRVYDRLDPVVERYCNDQPRPESKYGRSIARFAKSRRGTLLRIVASSPFLLHWSDDEWNTAARHRVRYPPRLELEYVDHGNRRRAESAAALHVLLATWITSGKARDYAIEIRTTQPHADDNHQKGGSG